MIINYQEIKNMDISFFKNYFYLNDNPTHHLLQQTGEHYKLLTYLSGIYDNITILDLGTNAGESAIALSQNKLNKVITYDIEKKWTTKFDENVEFKLTDIKDEYDSVLLSAKIIMLDIAHDGHQEREFTNRLSRIGYKGYVICDDIFNIYYPNMKPWWDSIGIEKYDITEVGHSWGTGIINYYQDNSIKIIN